MIYQPSEDSYLLSETLKKYLKDKPKNIKFLDMGSGSGIQAKTCRELGFSDILTADINPEAISHLKKQGFKTIKTDLFSHIEDKFNIIIFNPPYLPEDKREPEDSKLATTAGKKGYEIIIEFLKQAKSHLSNNGEMLLLFSSLSKPSVIKKKAKELGYTLNLLNKSRLFFEELYVYKLNR
jgi:release factor glutamine methyltransferase